MSGKEFFCLLLLFLSVIYYISHMHLKIPLHWEVSTHFPHFLPHNRTDIDNTFHCNLKLIFAIFLSFCFTEWYSLKVMKKDFYFQLQNFCIFFFPLFPSFNDCSRRWSKLNPKAYDVSSWLNENLKTHIIWYFEKETGTDILTWLIK